MVSPPERPVRSRERFLDVELGIRLGKGYSTQCCVVREVTKCLDVLDRELAGCELGLIHIQV